MNKKKIFLFPAVFIALSLTVVAVSFSKTDSTSASDPLPRYTAMPKPSVPAVVETENEAEMMFSVMSEAKADHKG